MACTKDGIYHDLTESIYKERYRLGNDDITLVFSSEFNQLRFKRRIKNYVHDETFKFNNKYKCKSDITTLLYISLYRMIEKRGFYVKLNNSIIKEVNGVLKVGE